jgi:Zn-dependent protease
MDIDSNLLFAGSLQMLVLLLAVTAHEAAHSWTAWRLGDSTSRDLGRVSLNPLRHLDLFGSVLLPLLMLISGGMVFGWAKPVPVDVSRLRRGAKDALWVTAAGPIANLALAGAGAAILRTVVLILGDEGRRAASLGLLPGSGGGADVPYFPLAFFLVQVVLINGFLALFNLLPVPPLDGGQILLQILPRDWGLRLARVRPYGLVIVLGLAVLNVLVVVVLPVYLALNLIIYW